MPLSKARMRERKKQDRLLVKPTSNLTSDVPFYDPLIHRTGDRVRIWQNGKQVEVIVP